MFVFDTKIATVRPYLLLGSAQHEHDYAMLREAGVTHILQVGSELRPSFSDRFEYLRISIDDLEQEDIIRPLRRCFAFIDKARHRDDGDGSLDADEAEGGGGGDGSGAAAAAPPPRAIVFVHCMAGMSRSASVVLAYLMSDEHLPYVEAFKQVKAARPCIYPNLGFLLQLWEWEAAGCDLDAWPGWGRARFAERLAEYRRAQDAAGLHRAVRVRLPMSPGAARAAAAAATAATAATGDAAATAATTAAADAAADAAAAAVGGRRGAANKANGEGTAAVWSSSCGRCVGGIGSDCGDGDGDGGGGSGSNVIRIGADSSSYHGSSEAGGDGGGNICFNLASGAGGAGGAQCPADRDPSPDPSPVEGVAATAAAAAAATDGEMCPAAQPPPPPPPPLAAAAAAAATAAAVSCSKAADAAGVAADTAVRPPLSAGGHVGLGAGGLEVVRG